MTTSTLLPLGEGLRFDGIVSELSHIALRIAAIAPSARCPECGQISPRVHSHYQRTLADLPWNKVAVRIHLNSRKFFCDHSGCKRLIFTEPLPQLAQRYAHKTLASTTPST